jgi:hypothetical protein
LSIRRIEILITEHLQGFPMPIEQRDGKSQLRAILIAVVGLIFAATLGYAVFRGSSGPLPTQQSSPSGNRGVFNAGDADRLAAAVKKDGPILLPDASSDGQATPIYLDHQGSNPRTGWSAIEARAPGGKKDCFVAWDIKAAVYRDSCTEEEYEREAEEFRSFPTKVTKSGDITVDVQPTK